MKRFLIGITGSTASGKSYLAKKISESLNISSVIFDQDNYFYDEEMQPKDENGEPNFDTPNSLDLPKFKDDFFKLINGNEIVQSKYNYNKPIEIGELEKVFKPADVIIVEGIFSFYFNEIFKSFDLTVFVESDMQTNINRRIIRDSNERGYDEDDVRYKFKHHVIESYNEYILPFKEKTDLIVHNSENESNLDEVLDVILKKIKLSLSS